MTFSGRVLVVEDNPVNQDVATGILENMGCTVVTAPNGNAAVQRCAQEDFDLILMDCEMPIMDGFDATKRIREIERVTGGLRGSDLARSRIPIVALTAHALAEVRDRCLEAGMDDFLVKPFDEQQMVDMLGRWLNPRAIATTADASQPSAAPGTLGHGDRLGCGREDPRDRRLPRLAAARAHRGAVRRHLRAAGRDDARALRRGRHGSGMARRPQPEIERRGGRCRRRRATLCANRDGGAGRPHAAPKFGGSRAR